MCLKNVNFSGGEAETVAYAAHCQQEAELDRPIAGHTNICPQALNSTKIEVHCLAIRTDFWGVFIQNTHTC